MPSSACNNDLDRKSTRLNSSHLGISDAVLCLQKNVGGPGCRLGGGARGARRASQVRRACTEPDWSVFSPRRFSERLVSWDLRPVCFFLMNRGPPRSTPFPRPPAFRI